MEKEIIAKLIDKAKAVSEKAYAPYSKFRVGAALLTKSGNIYVGTNVENRSFSLTICAERSAISTAVASGETEFVALAIYSPDTNKALPPCGACRQVISEFSSDCSIILPYGDIYKIVTISELYPFDSLHELK